jgi:hypothetical protein
VFAGKSKGVAVFGKKDYQQLMVIRQMVAQFALPIEVIGVDTCRAEDGLALSSRNGYLSESERAEALQLSLALRALGRDALAAADALAKHLPALEAKAIDNLRATMMQVSKVQDDIESNNELFKRLAEKSVSEQQVQYLIELISGVDFAKTPDQINNDHHGRQINRAKAIEDSIRKEMSYKGKTLWGLWSGVTHYTTHKAGRSEDARLANKLAGTGLQLDAMTLNRVSLWL